MRTQNYHILRHHLLTYCTVPEEQQGLRLWSTQDLVLPQLLAADGSPSSEFPELPL
jgi:hypothetical protein